MAESSKALRAPTCEFFGGPWDGRKEFYYILYTELRVPWFEDGGEVNLRITDETVLHNQEGPHHRYKRMSMTVKTGEHAYARYMYKGVVR